VCALLTALLGCVPQLAVAEVDPETSSATAQSTRSQRVATSTLRYDSEYPSIRYSSEPKHNAIARLQSRLNSGEVKLAFEGKRGYLDSLLRALDITPSSQTLVYSKTSLQFFAIRAATPRAIYFNDHTYVAWVQGSDMLELATMDSSLGPVFYTMTNRENARGFDRETSRCLTCHDKFGMSGGGVPQFTILSSLVDRKGESLNGEVAIEVDDATPIDKRWGGWYVTGQHGKQSHLGNIQANDSNALTQIDTSKVANLTSLQGLFDTRPYLTDQSDIVALMVLEHQTHIQNLITRINFKGRTFAAKDTGKPSPQWEEISPRTQGLLTKMIDSLVNGMLLVGAGPLEDEISGHSGFDAWFQSQGPRDEAGRSLRQLDLKTRLFKYPLSYLIYSEAFEGLPDYVKQRVYRRLAEILGGRDQSPSYAHLSQQDRHSTLEILRATKPAFAKLTAEQG
jgi:hypothetical protein